MKITKNISMLRRAALCIIVVCLMFGCRDEKELDPLSKMRKQLRGSWRVGGATLGDDDMSIFYHDMALVFSADHSFACENEVDPVWPASGTYETILEGDTRFIERGDGVRMTVISLTSTTLVVQFSWTAPNGRLKNLNGEYQFTFIR